MDYTEEELRTAVEGYGYELCEDPEGECDICDGQTDRLHFISTSYWDRREGDYVCPKCIVERARTDAEYGEYIEAQLKAGVPPEQI